MDSFGKIGLEPGMQRTAGCNGHEDEMELRWRASVKVKLCSRLELGDYVWREEWVCLEVSSWESQGQGDANRFDNLVEPLKLF